MATTNNRRASTTTNDSDIEESPKAVSSDELSQEHPLKAQPDMAIGNPGRATRDWQSEAVRLDGEVKFWKNKYFEALQYSQSQAQVVAMLARPQMEEDARQQAEIMAKIAQVANS